MITYLCVDKDGTEKASNYVPIRRQFNYVRIQSILGIFTGKYSKNQWNKWCDGWSTDDRDFLPFTGTILPKGTIEKLIGKRITWKDEPIELNINK